MKDFENACKELVIPLFVLPPAKSIYNGTEEFYEELCENSILGARRERMRFLRKYNSYRPQVSLHGATPLEYISKYSLGAYFCLISV